MPQEYSPNWPLDEETRADLVNRLGNLTLLEKRPNSELKDAAFVEKNRYYKKSTFALTRQVPKSWDSWGRPQIDERQKQLASLAVKAWSLKITA